MDEEKDPLREGTLWEKSPASSTPGKIHSGGQLNSRAFAHEVHATFESLVRSSPAPKLLSRLSGDTAEAESGLHRRSDVPQRPSRPSLPSPQNEGQEQAAAKPTSTQKSQESERETRSQKRMPNRELQELQQNQNLTFKTNDPRGGRGSRERKRPSPWWANVDQGTGHSQEGTNEPSTGGQRRTQSSSSKSSPNQRSPAKGGKQTGGRKSRPSSNSNRNQARRGKQTDGTEQKQQREQRQNEANANGPTTRSKSRGEAAATQAGAQSTKQKGSQRTGGKSRSSPSTKGQDTTGSASAPRDDRSERSRRPSREHEQTSAKQAQRASMEEGSFDFHPSPSPKRRSASGDVEDGHWTAKQDEQLTLAWTKVNPQAQNYWELVSEYVRGKSAQECCNRFHQQNEAPKVAKQNQRSQPGTRASEAKEVFEQEGWKRKRQPTKANARKKQREICQKTRQEQLRNADDALNPDAQTGPNLGLTDNNLFQVEEEPRRTKAMDAYTERLIRMRGQLKKSQQKEAGTVGVEANQSDQADMRAIVERFEEAHRKKQQQALHAVLFGEGAKQQKAVDNDEEVEEEEEEEEGEEEEEDDEEDEFDFNAFARSRGDAG